MDIPEKMRAVVLTAHGGPEVLQMRDDWPVPQPNDDQVLLKVGACGMNNTDVNTRSGWYSKTVTDATTGGSYDASVPVVGQGLDTACNVLEKVQKEMSTQ